jgi:hypothetical protein
MFFRNVANQLFFELRNFNIEIVHSYFQVFFVVFNLNIPKTLIITVCI